MSQILSTTYPQYRPSGEFGKSRVLVIGLAPTVSELNNKAGDLQQRFNRVEFPKSLELPKIDRINIHDDPLRFVQDELKTSNKNIYHVESELAVKRIEQWHDCIDPPWTDVVLLGIRVADAFGLQREQYQFYRPAEHWHHEDPSIPSAAVYVSQLPSKVKSSDEINAFRSFWLNVFRRAIK